MKRHDAFTIVEMVCILFILSILAVLAAFGISRLHQKAMISGSLSNLRHAYIGISAYAADHEGRIPANAFLGDPPRETLEENEIFPGMLDLPAALNSYIPEQTFLSPGNKKDPHEGYYLTDVGTSYWYKGVGQRLDGYDLGGYEFPLSNQKLLIEIKGWYGGKGCSLYADGRTKIE